MDSLIGIMKDLDSRFFTMFLFYTTWNYPSNLWFSDFFREDKRGEHWEETSQAFLLVSAQCSSFLPPCERQKTLDLLLFPGV